VNKPTLPDRLYSTGGQLTMIAIILMLTLVSVPTLSGTKTQSVNRWLTYRGAWFEVKYPSTFRVRPSLRSSSSTRGYDSVFFTAPDDNVEFYVFSPQWNGTASDIELVLLSISALIEGQIQNKYRIYHNVRFDYSISYPANILFPQGEAVNGDGQKFLSRDGRTEMLVYGSHNSLNQSLRQVYDEETSRTSEQPNRVVTYQVLRRDWFVVSGIEDGRIFYQKTLLRNGIFKTFRIEYNESETHVFNSITTKIAGSFKG
jgi:hypothetical protein